VTTAGRMVNQVNCRSTVVNSISPNSTSTNWHVMMSVLELVLMQLKTGQ